MQFVSPIPFKEAVDRLGSKTVVASGLDSQDWAFRVPVALRERAFFSSQIESAQFLQRTKDLLGDWMTGARETITMPDGSTTTALKTGSRAAFVEQARGHAQAEGLGPIDPKDRGGLKDITSRKRLNLIFDVQTQSAHDFGYWKQGMDPILLDEFPAARFVREAQVKQPRVIHQQNEGVVRLKSDLDFWLAMNSVSFGGFGVPYGPWGFNSGMGVEDVDRDEAEQLGLLAKDERIESPEADWNDRLRASTQNLDPDVQQFLRDTFGDQVEIRNGSAIWTGTPAAPAPEPTPVRPAGPPAPSAIPVDRRPAPVAPARSTSTPPVSRAVDLPSRGKVRKIAQSALRSIDSVHSDGTLDPFPVQPMPAKGGPLGVTVRSWGGNIRAVGVKSSGPWPELTVTHELGHVLDWVVLGGGRAFGSETVGGVMQGIMDAISRSKAVARLRLMAADATDPDLIEHISEYLLSKRELWARAYAQFIADGAEDATLKRQLAARLSQTGPQQWDAEDFAAIRREIEAAFKTMKWL